mgnify:FL=1
MARKAVARLTFDEGSDGPGVWSADGQTIYFRAVRAEGGTALYAVPANGSGAETLVHVTQTHHLHASPDGKHLLFELQSTGAGGLAALNLQDGKEALYLKQGFHPQFSPDSRMVAYESAETGRAEVYVQTFPAGGGKWQISTEGGIEPRWRADGKELFYDQGDGTVMAAALEMRGASLEVTSTTELFRFSRGRRMGTALAVSPDGKLVAIRETPAGTAASITVKLDWKLPR